MKPKLPTIIFLLALLGVALSTYSLLHNQGFASGKFCDINTTFNCDIVNKGPYGWFLGVPVSLLGIVGYGAMAAGAFLKRRNPGDKSLSIFLALSVGGGLVFSFYLSGIEAVVLHAWCLVCLTSQTTILAMAVLTAVLLLHERRSTPSLTPNASPL
ncbi:vitamin K epoxide reductase family protein [Candidatus Uhrbacteria bacterium]|nr:vitamin K epoxide reductase family protein [Candidatus Uhrbacteria bacterium]